MLRDTEGVWCDIDSELKEKKVFCVIDDLTKISLDESKYQIWTFDNPNVSPAKFAVSLREHQANDLYIPAPITDDLPF